MNMKKMQKTVMAAIMMLGLVVAPVTASVAMAQDAAQAAQNQQQGGGDLVGADGKAVDPSQQQKSGGGFFDIVFGSGIVGTILWFALFGDGAMAIYFAVDCFVLIKP